MFEIPANNPFVTALDWEIDRVCRAVYEKLRFSNESRYFLEKMYYAKADEYGPAQMAKFVGVKFAAKNYYVYVVQDEILHSLMLIVSRSQHKFQVGEKLVQDLTREEIKR